MKSLPILLSLILPGSLMASWSLQSLTHAGLDDAGYSIQQQEVALQHQWSENTSHELNLGYTIYGLDETNRGILAFAGEDPSIHYAVQSLQGLWWGRIQFGLQGFTGIQDAIGSMILARAIPNDGMKWTPRISLERSSLGSHALPLSLDATLWKTEVGLSWDTEKQKGDAGVSLEQWESSSVNGRTENVGLDSLPAPQILSAFAYSLFKNPIGIQWGYAISAGISDTTTQVPTSTNIAYSYNWMPAAAPMKSISLHALVQGTLLQSGNFTFLFDASIPLFSYQVRQWESTSIGDWGTAPVAVSLEGIHHGSFLDVRIRGEGKSTPWKHMEFFSSDAYMETHFNVLIQKQF
jgi:hypothetical protein